MSSAGTTTLLVLGVASGLLAGCGEGENDPAQADLRLVCHNEAAAGDGLILFRNRDDDNWQSTVEDLAAEGVELWAVAPGHGVYVGPVPQDGAIHLPAATQTTLRIAGDFPLPTAPYAFAIQVFADVENRSQAKALKNAVVPAEYLERGSQPGTKSLLFDPATRSATLLLPQTGKWNLIWMVTDRSVHASPGSYRETSYGRQGKATIPFEVVETGDVIEIEIDEAEFTELCAAVQR